VTGIGPIKNVAGNLVTENSEIAKELNEFFTGFFLQRIIKSPHPNME
jgi:hypothetical protein